MAFALSSLRIPRHCHCHSGGILLLVVAGIGPPGGGGTNKSAAGVGLVTPRFGFTYTAHVLADSAQLQARTAWVVAGHGLRDCVLRARSRVALLQLCRRGWCSGNLEMFLRKTRIQPQAG